MTIFKTRQPFREKYVPDTVVAHDDTISNLVRIFQDFVDGSRPPHLLIHGNSGTGKRTVIRHILDLVNREVEREIEVIRIDCDEYTSLDDMYVELAYLICEEDYDGHTQLELEQAIVRQIDDSDITWYLVFENLEGVGKDNLPFDELQQAISTYGTTQTECGVIGTTNQSRLYDHLPGEVIHRSYMHTVETTPYNATQLRHILEPRAEVAFSDDGFSETVLRKCAAIIARETGSAAEALQLLELAGYVASQADADQVTETHVQTARESLDSLRLYTTFAEELDPREQLLCTIIAAHIELDNEPITTKSLVKKYQDHCGSFDLTAVGKRRIEQVIVDLREKGLVHTQTRNIGRRGGMWALHETTAPARLILRSANATSGRFTRLLRKYYISVDHFKKPDEIDIEEFLSDTWSPQDSDIDLQNLDFYPT